MFSFNYIYTCQIVRWDKYFCKNVNFHVLSKDNISHMKTDVHFTLNFHVWSQTNHLQRLFLFLGSFYGCHVTVTRSDEKEKVRSHFFRMQYTTVHIFTQFFSL